MRRVVNFLGAVILILGLVALGWYFHSLKEQDPDDLPEPVVKAIEWVEGVFDGAGDLFKKGKAAYEELNETVELARQYAAPVERALEDIRAYDPTDPSAVVSEQMRDAARFLKTCEEAGVAFSPEDKVVIDAILAGAPAQETEPADADSGSDATPAATDEADGSESTPAAKSTTAPKATKPEPDINWNPQMPSLEALRAKYPQGTQWSADAGDFRMWVYEGQLILEAPCGPHPYGNWEVVENPLYSQEGICRWQAHKDGGAYAGSWWIGPEGEQGSYSIGSFYAAR